MSYSAPLELLTDASGSVTFGWADDGVYYARFSRCLSAKLGEAFALRLRAAVQSGPVIEYFADARALESYDLLARSAFVRVVSEHRRKFRVLAILSWGSQLNPALLAALGEPILALSDPIAFETRLLSAAPKARSKLGARPEARFGPRSPLRR
jgi:hypothetical protein